MAFKTVAPRAAPPERGIMKQANNALPKNFMLNASAVAVAALLVALGIRGMIVQDDMVQCSERFGNGTLFGMQDKGGGPISAADLQARLAGSDWGIIENVKLFAEKDAPAPVAMQIGLPKVAAKVEGAEPQKSGMGFTWLMPKLAAARSACLTYNVWLPADFEFGAGGTLPGLLGSEASDVRAIARSPSFSVRQGWGKEGAVSVRSITAASAMNQDLTIDPERLQFPRGRWVRLEQEVTLNQPGKEDGELRVWVDGKLYVENTEVAFRKDDKMLFRGLVADVHYGDGDRMPNAVPKSTAIKITPFELRWQ